MIRQVNSGGYVKSYIAQTPDGLIIPSGLLYRLEGYFETGAATDEYVQIFDSATVPVDGTVPLKSYLAQENFVFSQHIGEGLVFENGCCIVLSTTEATKTIATASGDNIDVRLDIEVSSSLAVPVTIQTAGDFVTSVSSQRSWTGGLLNRLRRISVTEQSGVVTYVQLYTTNPTTGVSVPWKQFPLAANATLDLEFGQNGIPVYADATFQTLSSDMWIKLCSNSGQYVAGDVTTGTIYVEYIEPTSN